MVYMLNERIHLSRLPALLVRCTILPTFLVSPHVWVRYL